MPAINTPDNLIKLKVFNECNESHGEFHDHVKAAVRKPPKASKSKDYSSSSTIYLKTTPTRLRVCGALFFGLLSIWFLLTTFLVFYPPTYCREYCNELLTEAGVQNDGGKKALFKLQRHLEKFNELSSLYGRYFNISDDKINSALRDSHLWLVIYGMIGDEDMTEQDRVFIRKNSFRYYRMGPEGTTMTITSFLPKPLQALMGVKDPSEWKISDSGINKYYDEKKRFNLPERKAMAKEEPKKESILPSGRLSANNKYLLYDKVFVGEKFDEISKNSMITLTTQSSVDRLKSFVVSATKWTGPFSLAVFVNGSDQYCAFEQYFQYLQQCKADILQRTLISLATPKEDDLAEQKPCHLGTSSCASLETLIATPEPKNPSPSQGPGYPQNTMRNLAKYNIPTPYHLMLDIDIIPSAKMSESLNRFLKDKPIFKNGLVIPTYEVSIKATFPVNKAELVNLRRKGQAQPFHKEVFALNQNATDFVRWEKIHDTFDDVSIVYDVEKFHLYYEPFFVEHQSGPLYNESFIGYGFTRSSHAYETYLKNGNFQVLSPVFTVQMGLQKIKEWSPERQKQNNENHFIFQRFVANLNNKTRFDWKVSQLHLPPLFP